MTMNTLFLSFFFCFFVQLHTSLAVPVQLYGLNYNTRQGADWNPNKCKSYEQVERDLTVLSRITNRIRILSLYDCGQGQLVLQVAKELSLKVFLGLWVSDDETVFDKEVLLLEDLIQKGLLDGDTILGISVGSESIYRKEITVAQSIEYFNQVKTILQNAGYGDLPVSVCDIAPTYQYNTRLTTAVDVVVTNSFPFWEAIDINDATDYLVTEFDTIESVASSQGKEIILGETGWPSDGFISGVGVASPENQAQFFVDFYCRMDRELNWNYYWFTGIDNAWRKEQDPNNTIEGNWGLMFADLELKPWFQNLTFTCPSDASVQYTLSEIDFSAPEITPPPTVSPAPTTTASCQSHPECAELAGNCCPNDDGIVFWCCDSTISGGGTNTTASPPTATPSGMSSSSKEPTIVTESSEPMASPAETTLTPSVTGTMDATATPSTASPTLAPSTAAPTSGVDDTNPPTNVLPANESPTAPVSTPTRSEPTPAPSMEQGGKSPNTPAPTPTLATINFDTSNTSNVERYNCISLALVIGSLLMWM